MVSFTLACDMVETQRTDIQPFKIAPFVIAACFVIEIEMQQQIFSALYENLSERNTLLSTNLQYFMNNETFKTW